MKRIYFVFLIVIIGLLLTVGLNYSLTYLHLNEKINKIVEYTLTAVYILVFFIVLFRGENIYTKLPWLVAIYAFPSVGIVLYLTFAVNFKQTRRYSKRVRMHKFNYLVHEDTPNFDTIKMKLMKPYIKDIFKTSYALSHHNIYQDDTRVTLIDNGDNFFPSLIEKLYEANDFIFMQFFIIKESNITSKVFNILKEKASSGVQVILMYDYFGGLTLPDKDLNELNNAGVEIVPIDKVVFPLFNSKVNYRNHRKITIIDSKYAYIGGINLGDEYNHQSNKYGFWRDTQLLIEGCIINSMMSIFIKDYYYSTGKFIENEKYYQAQPVNSNGCTQVIQSGPDSHLPIIRNTYLKMILSAKKSIKIITPYLVLDNELESAIKVAAESGVEVSIIVPGFPDKFYVYKATQSFFDSLLKSGVNIYTYRDHFIHSKVLIIDDEIASVGSFNLDMRSFILNFEATVLFTGNTVKDLVQSYANDISDSDKIDIVKWIERPLYQKLLETMFGLVASLM